MKALSFADDRPEIERIAKLCAASSADVLRANGVAAAVVVVGLHDGERGTAKGVWTADLDAPPPVRPAA